MHDLFTKVLSNRDLSRAGDLFSVADGEIVHELTEVLKEINKIISQSSYLLNTNDQSVIEICIARCLACIRDSGKAEQYCGELVEILETCLFMGHLQLSSAKNVDPPHAKISSDIISSIFLNYNSKRSVMELSIPVAVRFLNKGNKELSRNLASYLSLIAIEHAQLLSPHINLVLDSILTDNYGLSRILLSLYEINPEPIVRKCSDLVEIIPKCETQEQLTLLQLAASIAKTKPSALHGSLQQLVDLLPNPALTQTTLLVLHRVSEHRPLLILEYSEQIRAVGNPQCVSLVGQILSAVGKLGKEQAQVALDYVLEHLSKSTTDRATYSTLLQEAKKLCTQYPVLLTEKVTAVVRQRQLQTNGDINKTSGGVTIVKLNQTLAPAKPQVSTTIITNNPTSPNGAVPHTGYTRRAKLGDSRSTGRLHSGGTNTRSMTRLNIGSVGGLHKSMTRLSSSQHINGGAVPPPPNNVTVVGNGSDAKWNPVPVLKSGNVTVTTSPTKPRPYSTGPFGSSTTNFYKGLTHADLSSNALNQSTGSIGINPVSVHHATPASPVTTLPIVPQLSSTDSSNQVSVYGPSTEVSRRFENKSVTLITPNQRGSVFEPLPMRDTIQHFCEKHLDKIKAYTKNISRSLPPPAKCTIEKRQSKKLAKLHFACQIRGPHCLYSKTFFIMKTKNPKTWIHLMFLDLQSRAGNALSSWDSSVTSLKHCWDTLKCENKTFITLVTSAFPGPKDTDSLLYELRHSGFFDVFELGPATPEEAKSEDFHYQWGCFLCNHPEKAMGFLEGNNQPVIEGQLKEKKGKWRLFRRWRTRYFTLSGAHLSCKSGGESIDINQIRSVKVSRGARNIPKAFEIFTGDQTLILKPKDGKNAEEWVQCLSIVVAHSQARDTPPAKTNSLPARGLNRFSTFEGSQ